MTAAQRAMATAMIYPDPEKGGKGKRSQNWEGLSDAQKKTMFNRLSQARAVLKYSTPMATSVLAGSKSLDEAYNEVQVATGKRSTTTPSAWRRQRGYVAMMETGCHPG